MDPTNLRRDPSIDSIQGLTSCDNECMNSSALHDTKSLSINSAQGDFIESSDIPVSDEETCNHISSPYVDHSVNGTETTEDKTELESHHQCCAGQYVDHVDVVVNPCISDTSSDKSSSIEVISDSASNSSYCNQCISDSYCSHLCKRTRHNIEKTSVAGNVDDKTVCARNKGYIECCDNWTKEHVYSTSDNTQTRHSNPGALWCYQCSDSQCFSKKSMSVHALDLNQPGICFDSGSKNKTPCHKSSQCNAQNRSSSLRDTNTVMIPEDNTNGFMWEKDKETLDDHPCCSSGSPSGDNDQLMFKSIPNLCYTNKADAAGDITCSTLNLLHSSMDDLSENVNFDVPPADTVSLPADVRGYAKIVEERRHHVGVCGGGCDGDNINTLGGDDVMSEPRMDVYQRSFSEPGLVRQRRMQIYGIAQRRKRIWYRRVPTLHRGSVAPSGYSIVEENSSFSLRKLSRNDKWMLLCLAISNVCSMMCLSVLAPFFPSEAVSKGVDQNISGWIFGVFPLTEVLVAPVFGKLVNHISPRFMFLSGQFFAGSCYILFGFLEYVPTQYSSLVFIALCFLLRIFTAVGTSAMSTASFTIIAFVFGDHLSTVFGILETATGLGLSLGPALGGILYDAGGFMLPFVSLGSFMVVLVPITRYLLPSIEEEDQSSSVSENHITVFKLLRIPSIFITCMCTFVAAVVWATPDPILSLHLTAVSGYELSSTMIGLLFLLEATLYGIFCPIWGWLCDKLENTTPMLILGFLLSGLAVMLLGPSPNFGLPAGYNELWLNIVALIVMGVALSLAIVPTFEKIVDTAERAGFEESIETYGVVAGLWASCYALGDFAGPTVGGFLTAKYSFPWCMTFIAYICGATAIVVLCLWVCEKNFLPMHVARSICLCCKGQAEKQSGHKDTYNNNNDECKSLLDDQRTRYGTQDCI